MLAPCLTIFMRLIPELVNAALKRLRPNHAIDKYFSPECTEALTKAGVFVVGASHIHLDLCLCDDTQKGGVMLCMFWPYSVQKEGAIFLFVYGQRPRKVRLLRLCLTLTDVSRVPASDFEIWKVLDRTGRKGQRDSATWICRLTAQGQSASSQRDFLQKSLVICKTSTMKYLRATQTDVFPAAFDLDSRGPLNLITFSPEFRKCFSESPTSLVLIKHLPTPSSIMALNFESNFSLIK